MTTPDPEVLRAQLSALHATATALVQQVAVVLAGLPAPESAQQRRRQPPAAHDLPANLND